MNKTGRPIQGNQLLTAVGTANLFTAPGATARNVIFTINISHFLLKAASYVQITDGTTVFFKWDTTAIRMIPAIDFGENGFYMAKNKALVLQVAGADCDVHSIATGEVRGKI